MISADAEEKAGVRFWRVGWLGLIDMEDEVKEFVTSVEAGGIQRPLFGRGVSVTHRPAARRVLDHEADPGSPELPAMTSDEEVRVRDVRSDLQAIRLGADEALIDEVIDESYPSLGIVVVVAPQAPNVYITDPDQVEGDASRQDQDDPHDPEGVGADGPTVPGS